MNEANYRLVPDDVLGLLHELMRQTQESLEDCVLCVDMRLSQHLSEINSVHVDLSALQAAANECVRIGRASTVTILEYTPNGERIADNGYVLNSQDGKRAHTLDRLKVDFLKLGYPNRYRRDSSAPVNSIKDEREIEEPSVERGSSRFDPKLSEELYQFASDELNSERRIQAVWDRSVALANNDVDEARFLYKNLRVEQLLIKQGKDPYNGEMPLSADEIDSSLSEVADDVSPDTDAIADKDDPTGVGMFDFLDEDAGNREQDRESTEQLRQISELQAQLDQTNSSIESLKAELTEKEAKLAALQDANKQRDGAPLEALNFADRSADNPEAQKPIDPTAVMNTKLDANGSSSDIGQPSLTETIKPRGFSSSSTVSVSGRARVRRVQSANKVVVLSAAAVLLQVDDYLESLNKSNSFKFEYPDHFEEHIQFVEGLQFNLRGLIEATPIDESAVPIEEIEEARGFWDRLRKGVEEDMARRISPESIAPAISPAIIMGICGGLGLAMTQTTVGFGIGTMFGKFFLGEMKPGAAADKVKEALGSEGDGSNAASEPDSPENPSDPDK